MAAHQPSDQDKTTPEQPMEDPKGRSSLEEIAHKGAQGIQVLADKLTPAADDSRYKRTPASSSQLPGSFNLPLRHLLLDPPDSLLM